MSGLDLLNRINDLIATRVVLHMTINKAVCLLSTSKGMRQHAEEAANTLRKARYVTNVKGEEPCNLLRRMKGWTGSSGSLSHVPTGGGKSAVLSMALNGSTGRLFCGCADNSITEWDMEVARLSINPIKP